MGGFFLFTKGRVFHTQISLLCTGHCSAGKVKERAVAKPHGVSVQSAALETLIGAMPRTWPGPLWVPRAWGPRRQTRLRVGVRESRPSWRQLLGFLPRVTEGRRGALWGGLRQGPGGGHRPGLRLPRPLRPLACALPFALGSSPVRWVIP